MSRITPDVWIRLASSSLHGDVLVARSAVPQLTDRLVAALGANGRRHLLIALHPGEEGCQDTRSRGMGVVSRELVMTDHESGRYIDITCHDVSGHDVFDLIGGELAQRLSLALEPPAQCVLRVLAKWRRFWGNAPQHLLSYEEQVGLFTELWFLSRWLMPRLGAGTSVVWWRGPFGARHDFESTSLSIEAKGTTSTQSLVHRIHGIEQLMPPERGDLLFFSMRLRQEAGAENTLPALIAMCQAQLAEEDDSLNRFESTLANTGYSPLYEEEYSELRFRVVEEALFAVRDDFPRLTPLQLSAEISMGVTQVDYDIDLAGFPHLRIARTPEEATII